VNYREALAIHRRVLGENHPFIATDLHNLGRLLESRGNIPDAEQLLRESMAVLDKVHDGPMPTRRRSCARWPSST
jgi:hypothetical protein